MAGIIINGDLRHYINDKDHNYKSPTFIGKNLSVI